MFKRSSVIPGPTSDGPSLKKRRKMHHETPSAAQAAVFGSADLNRRILDMVAHECINRPILSLATNAWASQAETNNPPMIFTGAAPRSACVPPEQPTEAVFFALANVLWQAFLAQRPPNDEYNLDEISFASKQKPGASPLTLSFQIMSIADKDYSPVYKPFEATLTVELEGEQVLIVYLHDLASKDEKLTKQPRFQIVEIRHVYPDPEDEVPNWERTSPHAAFIILAKGLRHLRMPLEGTVTLTDRWKNLHVHVLPATFKFEVNKVGHLAALLKGANPAANQAQ